MGTVALGPLPMCCSYPLSSRPGIARLVSNRYSPTPSPGLAENVKRGRSFSISASSAAPAGPNSPGGFWGLVGAIRGLLFPNGGAAGGDLDGGKCLQSGGIGVALLSLTATARMKISPAVSVLAVNPTFLSGLLAWFTAQSSKVLLNFFLEKKLDLRIYFGCGGMPSSHSALCTALTTSVGLCHGMADSLFAVCLGFSLIVMYDAIGVRRHAGLQAEVLNVIIEDLFQGHPISRRKLRELLGHTPSQVLAGALIGIAVACFCHRACLLPSVIDQLLTILSVM